VTIVVEVGFAGGVMIVVAVEIGFGAEVGFVS